MPRPPTVPGSVPLVQAIDHRSLMLLGTAPRPFKDPAFGWEVKLDGYRMLAFCNGGQARLVSRWGRDTSAAFPEVVEGLKAIPYVCVLDGELTVPDAQGRPDFEALRPRAVMTNPWSILVAVKTRPAIYYAFDLLALGDRDLRPATLVARRHALSAFVLPGSTSAVRSSDLWDDGPALLRTATELDLEGIVGKRLESPYVAGRSKDWLKVRASTARPQGRR